MKSFDVVLKTLVSIYDEVSSRQTKEGKTLHIDNTFTIFGQCTGLYYAALYKLDHQDNPYFGNPLLLKRSLKSWDYYISLLNDEGQAPLITFSQFWEYFYDEWGILHLINTVELLKDDMEPEKLSMYRQKIDRAVIGIENDIKKDYQDPVFLKQILNHEVANHFLWRITCLFRYASLRNDKKQMDFCSEIIHFVCKNQLPFGTWLEGGSLVVNYSHTTLGALGQFLAYTDNKDKIVYHAVLKNMEYLLKCYYKNTQTIGCFDSRNKDEVFFEFTFLCGSMLDNPIGVQYNSKHILSKFHDPSELYIKQQSLGYYVDAFLSMTQNVELVTDSESDKEGVIYIDKLDKPIEAYSENTLNTIKICKNDFIVPICILKNRSYNVRWHLQRQNLFSVFHKKANIIIGGGHSIASPEFSCFNIISNGSLHYLHNRAKFLSDSKFEVVYDDVTCTVEILEIKKDEITIEYTAKTLKDLDKCVVNIPVFVQYIHTIRTDKQLIDVKNLSYYSEFFENHADIYTDQAVISVDSECLLTYPVFSFDNYKQIQKPAFHNAYLILKCPLHNQRNKVKLHIKIKS